MFYKKNKLIIFSLFLLFFIISESKSVDEFDYNFLNERLNRIELELSDLQKSIYTPEKNIKSNDKKKGFVSSRHEIRINKLENEFRKITGQFEEIFFRIDQLQEKLDKFNSDLDFRLSTKDDASTGGLPTGARDRSNEPDTFAYQDNTSEVNTSGGDSEILGTLKRNKRNEENSPTEIANNFQTPESLYDYAKTSLMNLEYVEAEIAFRGFVKKYPKNDLTPEAQYWIGESLFVREQYNEAILMYGQVIKDYKKSKKAPDSLLKIGIAFENLNKKKEACNALKKVNKNYPNSDPSILKKANYQMQELGC